MSEEWDGTRVMEEAAQYNERLQDILDRIDKTARDAVNEIVDLLIMKTIEIAFSSGMIRGLWIGVAIGIAIGGTVASIVTLKVMR